jgi:hypothetical protein
MELEARGWRGKKLDLDVENVAVSESTAEVEHPAMSHAPPSPHRTSGNSGAAAARTAAWRAHSPGSATPLPLCACSPCTAVSSHKSVLTRNAICRADGGNFGQVTRDDAKLRRAAGAHVGMVAMSLTRVAAQQYLECECRT